LSPPQHKLQKNQLKITNSQSCLQSLDYSTPRKYDGVAEQRKGEKNNVHPKFSIQHPERKPKGSKAKSDWSKNTFMMLDRSKRGFSAKGTPTECPSTDYIYL